MFSRRFKLNNSVRNIDEQRSKNNALKTKWCRISLKWNKILIPNFLNTRLKQKKISLKWNKILVPNFLNTRLKQKKKEANQYIKDFCYYSL